MKKNHPAQKEVQQNTERLMNKWNELLQASANRGRGLGEARDILEFNEQADKVEMWIREKVGKIAARQFLYSLLLRNVDQRKGGQNSS